MIKVKVCYKMINNLFINCYMKFFLIIFIFALFFKESPCQSPPDSTVKQYEDTLINLFNEAFTRDSIRYLKTDNEKKEINEKIIAIFNIVLQIRQSFDYPFVGLKYVSIINSNDKSVRIYTWNLKFTNQEYKFFGFIQYLQKINY